MGLFNYLQQGVAMNLEVRVANLESENRRIKRFGLTTIAVTLLLCATMGSVRKNYTAFDWISAYGFTVRDEAARDRGGIAYHPKVGPYFYLKDNEGNTRVKITLDGLARE
jgi:hypothetical protein